MRVGLLTTSFPRSHHDIAGRFVLGFAESLVSAGHEVDVLAPEPRESLPKLALSGIDVSYVRYLPRPLERTFYGAGVLDNLVKDPLAWLGLLPFSAALTNEASKRQRDWDVIVSHWAVPCALSAKLARKKQRHVAVLHSADVFVLERLPKQLGLAAQVASGADALLFVSRDLRTRFLRLLDPLARTDASAKSSVCAMGIDAPTPSSISRAALRKKLGLAHFTVLSLGRLVSIKGLSYAIDALCGREDVELVIVGDGPERAALERHAAQTQTRVRFVGALFGEEKSEWFRASDAFVLPSLVLPSGRSEGLPTTLLEAMSYGLVPIATEAGGIVDAVRHEETGLLVPPANAAKLGEALDLLRTDPKLLARLSVAAREVGSSYTWQELTPHLDALIRG